MKNMSLLTLAFLFHCKNSQYWEEEQINGTMSAKSTYGWLHSNSSCNRFMKMDVCISWLFLVYPFNSIQRKTLDNSPVVLPSFTLWVVCLLGSKRVPWNTKAVPFTSFHPQRGTSFKQGDYITGDQKRQCQADHNQAWTAPNICTCCLLWMQLVELSEKQVF